MNERIRQIAEQAGFKTNWQHEDVQAIKMARFEKFAELIVKECIDLALGSSHREDDMGAIIANKIKKHFGVEE